MPKVKLLNVILLCLFFFSFTAKVLAQEPLKNSLVDSTVIKLGNLMRDYYILKEKGELLNNLLLSNLKNKKYYTKTGPKLANLLLEDLQSAANDKHLMIKFYENGDASKDYPETTAPIDEDYTPSEASLKKGRLTNYGFTEVSILDMNIGYLKLNGFFDIRNPEVTAAATAAMNFLAHTNGIILDLSDNTGGDAATLQFLISYFFKADPQTHYNTFHFRDGNDHYIEERTLPFVPGLRLSKTPLYVITSNKTFSAGEACAYSLKNLGRATIIGQTTGGGAHAADFKLINDYFDMSIPMARALNPITKTNWEGVGVTPDIEMDLTNAKLYAHVALLKTAMKKETDQVLRSNYQWTLENLEAQLIKFSITENELKKFVGKYDGDRSVFIENGYLKYRRGQGKVATLTPLTKFSFKSDTFNDVRIGFDIDGDNIMGMKLYLQSGQFNLARKLE